MLRRLANLGHPVTEDDESMSPSPGDEASTAETKGSGGLAGVFRGLTGSKSKTSLHSPAHPPASSPLLPMGATAITKKSAGASATPRGLPLDQAKWLEHLRTGSSHERISAASSLRLVVADYSNTLVLEVWYAAKDLIDPSKMDDVRLAGWELLTECTKCSSSTDVERREYFQTITAAAIPKDFHLQLAALEDLTNNGRDCSGFNYDIFPVVTSWLEQAYVTVSAARKHAPRGSGKSKGKASVSGGEKNLSNLFNFVKQVIKFNFKFASDTVVAQLIDALLNICTNTIVEDDLSESIGVIDTLVTFGAIPRDKLKDCIPVLGSIHFLVSGLQKDAWHTISNICKSHHGRATVGILLDALRNCGPIVNRPKEKDETSKHATRDVNGALSVLRKLTSKSTDKGYPIVPFALLVDGLLNVSKNNVPKIATGCVMLLNVLFNGADGSVNSIIADEDWAALFDVAAQCVVSKASPRSSESDLSIKSTPSREERETEDNVDYQLKLLIKRIEYLLRHHSHEITQRDECLDFLTGIRHLIPDSAASLVLDYLKENRVCYPPDIDWEANLDVLVGFFLDRSRQRPLRLQALGMIVAVYDFLQLVDDLVGPECLAKIAASVLSAVEEEKDPGVLQETMEFVIPMAETASPELFAQILDSTKNIIAKERAKSLLAPPVVDLTSPADVLSPNGSASNPSLSNIVATSYVRIFLRTLNRDAGKAIPIFQALIHIARSNACEADARLTAIKLLFRLRADAENSIYVTPQVDGIEPLAAVLYRTETALARKLAEDAAHPSRASRNSESAAPPSRPSRGVSFTQSQPSDRVQPSRTLTATRSPSMKLPRLWSLPDSGALPEAPPSMPTPLLCARLDLSQRSTAKRSVLNMASWLEALLSLFHQGCDWEVYSYVIVHLPAQLSSHPIFSDALQQVQELRRVLCEVIRMNSFQEPPSSSGLRRSDAAYCLFTSLTMMLSYHSVFSKLDEDEIVRTFMHGITDRNARACIHALSVCCHELPLSVSKSLVTILQKMSQVITQPLVAMHILEFLASLSRLHSLYSNFREDEYRIVFGICFRYLQYVRDKKRSIRGSYSSEPTTPSPGLGHQLDGFSQTAAAADDLPEYVYALAFHVITFWFLAVKIPERPNHIGWIAKNLFTDVDGSVSNEEQAQITLDFMQRVAFSDASDSVGDPLFTEQYFGEIQQKHWIMGNSIVTIKQAKESGWAEVVRRYPSGISAFSINSKSTPMADDFAGSSDTSAPDGNSQPRTTTFPSHLLMQLLVPTAPVHDVSMRPVPLPDDDTVERSLRLFDHISAVDGHKVGVVYIREGQTKETEILANTVGSPDYHEFLKGLGTLTRLQGATFNTQGLDREYDTDGQYTFHWRDRVTEIMFHVTTQMPTNLERDAQCIAKKRHIGNDFVNIIFNDSGLPFRFDTFPSEFNFVNIVISPMPRWSLGAIREGAKARAEDDNLATPLFMVQLLSKPGFPEISPASEAKIVGLKALPSFVRLLSLNASVFSHVWANREGGEHVSSWRSRLREIRRLRERYGPKISITPSPPPSSMGNSIAPALVASAMAQAHSAQGEGSRPASSVRDSFSSLRRSSVATFFTSASTDQTPHSHRSSILSTTTTDHTEVGPGMDSLVDSVDFSKWA